MTKVLEASPFSDLAYLWLDEFVNDAAFDYMMTDNSPFGDKYMGNILVYHVLIIYKYNQLFRISLFPIYTIKF